MKILVTGGAGFIGSHLVDYYLKKGDEVWAIDDLSTGQRRNLPDHENLRFALADVSQYPHLDEAVAWSDRIIHAAATVGMLNVLAHPSQTFDNNLHTMDALFTAIKKQKKKIRLLFLSSSGVYWHSPLEHGVLSEKTPIIVHPEYYNQEPYSLSKIAGEVKTLCLGEEEQLFCTVARIFNTIGVRQSGKYGMVVPRMIKQAIKNEPLTVFGDGKQTRSFVNVHDTVKALAQLLETDGARGEIINVGHDREIAILELAELIKKSLNSKSEIIFIPYREAYGMDFIDVPHRRPSLEKMKKVIGFVPEWTLEESIIEIAASLEARKV